MSKSYTYTVKLDCEADTNSLKAVETALSKINKAAQDIKIGKSVSSEFSGLASSLSKLDADKINTTVNAVNKLNKATTGLNTNLNIKVNDSGLQNVQGHSQEAVGGLKNVKSEAEAVSRSVSTMSGQGLENINSSSHIATKGLQSTGVAASNVQRQLNGINGSGLENVVSQANAATDALEKTASSAANVSSSTADIGSTIGDAISGGASAITGKSLYDLTIGSSIKRETQNSLMAASGANAPVASAAFDRATNKGLLDQTSLMSAMPALNSRLGTSYDDLAKSQSSLGGNTYADVLENIGTKAIGMGMSSEEAATRIAGLGNTIKGADAMTDDLGLSVEALKATGLWDGTEEDLDGFMAAVNKVTGDTSTVMDTTAGKLATLGKEAGVAGRDLGNMFCSVLNPALDFLGYLKQIGLLQPLLKVAIGAGALITGIVGVVAAFKTLKKISTSTIDGIKDGWNAVKSLFGKGKPSKDSCPVSDSCSDALDSLGGATSKKKNSKNGSSGTGSNGKISNTCPLDNTTSGTTIGGSKESKKKGKTAKSGGTGKTAKDAAKAGTEIEKATAKTGRFSGALSKLGKIGALANIASSFGGIGGKISGSLGKVAGKMGGVGSKIGGSLVGKGGSGIIGSIGSKLGGGLGKVFGKMGTGIMGKIGAKLGGKLAGGLLVSLIPGVGQVVDAFLLITTILDVLGIDWWGPLCWGAQQLYGILTGALGGAFSWLQATGSSALNGIVGALNWVNDGILGVANAIMGGLTGAFNWLMTTGSSIWNTIAASVNIVTAAITWLKNLIMASLGTAFTTIMTIATSAWNAIAASINWVVMSIAGFITTMMSVPGIVASALGAVPGIVSGALGSALGSIISWAGQAASSMGQAGRNMVSQCGSALSGLAGAIGNELRNALNQIVSIGGQMAQKAYEIGQKIWQSVISGLGIGSPGYIQILTAKEFKDTTSQIEAQQNPMASAALNAGKQTVTGYNTGQQSSVPSNSSRVSLPTTTATANANNGSNQAATITNNFNFNNAQLDSEKRIDEFANAVIKKMTFDTVKAGRNVNNTQYIGG